ncbi:MAG: ATP-dependent DNA helicase, partial [Desulfatitalea sp.]|nr:ATP-dependent DNA helicase [Desulfatitalea sp.]
MAQRRRYPSRSPQHRGRTSHARVRDVVLRPGADAKLKRVFARIGTPEPAPFVPDPFQARALELTAAGDCLVTAPTGAGKTWIAVEAIRRIFAQGG